MIFAGRMGGTGLERRTLTTKLWHLLKVLVYCVHVDKTSEVSRVFLTLATLSRASDGGMVVRPTLAEGCSFHNQANLLTRKYVCVDILNTGDVDGIKHEIEFGR